jgi:hypothetical protein
VFDDINLCVDCDRIYNWSEADLGVLSETPALWIKTAASLQILVTDRCKADL